MTTTSTKPAGGNDAATPAEPTALKKNALGTGSIAFLVISAAAPLTVISGSVPLALMIAGPGAPAAYLIVGVVLAIFAFAFLGMVAHSTKSGGFYTYITHALGRKVGLGSGFLALASYNAMQIGIFGLFAVGAGQLLRTVAGIDVPWGVLAFLAIALVWAVGFTGIEVGARILGVLLVLEIIMLVVLGVAIIATGGSESGLTFTAFNPENVFTPGFAATLALCFGAFMGFESTVLFRAEAKNPHRTVPRATYISVVATTVFYVAVVWVLGQAYGDSLIQAAVSEAGPSAFFFATTDATLGTWATITFQVLVVTSAFAALLAFHNSINRYFYVLGRDGVLPAGLARTRTRTGSPWVAGLVQTALSVVIVGIFALANADPYLNLLLWLNTPGVLGVLILQILAAIAVVVYFRRNPEKARHRLVVPAAVASIVILIAFSVLSTVNIAVLTGASDAVNAIIVASMPLALGAGVGWAFWLKAKRRAAYEQIGEDE